MLGARDRSRANNEKTREREEIGAGERAKCKTELQQACIMVPVEVRPRTRITTNAGNAGANG